MQGDTLWRITQRVNEMLPPGLRPITISDILKYNMICNPNIIIPDEYLFLPTYQPVTESGFYKAGASVYYKVRPGDTLDCIAKQLVTTTESLVQLNQYRVQDLLRPGTELLFRRDFQSPEELQNRWNSKGAEISPCWSIMVRDYLSLYGDTFLWEQNGSKSIQYLLNFLKHSCQFIRYFAALSLGRIGLGANEVIAGLTKLSADPEIIVADIAKLALKRISLINQYGREIHVAINDIRLYNEPTTDNVNYSLYSLPIFPKGTSLVVRQWGFADNNGKTVEGLPNTQLYDNVLIYPNPAGGFIYRNFLNIIDYI